jgi:D-beta-D-heptose 7-phosphate kinase/D-beta-D-heptose 1-phosphate adenosyltransferase
MNKIIVNGTFDIIHRGHIEMLNYAKSLGGYLLVLIDSDSRVKELKGSNRPVNNQHDRQFVLNNIKAVDDVWLFDSEQDLIDKIKMYSPDIMVKGSDYRGKAVVGKELVSEIIYYDRTEHSTTKTIQDLIDRGHL